MEEKLAEAEEKSEPEENPIATPSPRRTRLLKSMSRKSTPMNRDIVVLGTLTLRDDNTYVEPKRKTLSDKFIDFMDAMTVGVVI